VLPGDLSLLVDWLLEMKSNTIQIKDMHFSSLINKVQDINSLLKFQPGQTILVPTSVRYILANSYKRPIENDTLFDDKIIQILSANILFHMVRPIVRFCQS
jgi:hypothetical protein